MTFAQSRSFRFLRNVGWNAFGQAGIVGIAFLATPYLVRRMGLEAYGLYILMHAAAGYLLLTNLGTGGAASKFIAERRAIHDEKGVRGAARAAAAVHIIGALGGAAILGYFAPTVAFRLFHVAAPLLPDATFVLRCAAAGAVGAAAVQLAVAMLQGFQRFDAANGLSLIQNGLMPLGVVAALHAGLGVRGAASWFVALNWALAIAALTLIATKSTAGAAGPAQMPTGFRRMAASLWFGQAAWIVMFQVDKIYISRALPLTELTLYSVPSGLLQRMQAVPIALSGVLIPMVSELHGDVKGDLARMYLKTLRLLLWIILPLLGLLFAFLPQLLTLWLGMRFSDASVWPCRILIIAQLIFLVSYVPASIATGRGKAYYFTYAAWAQSAISLVAWWALVPRLHLYGAAIGALLAQLLPALFYIPLVHRRMLGLGTARYLQEGLLPPAAAAAITFSAALAVHRFADNWPLLLALGAICGALHLPASWSLFPEDDRKLVREFLRWRPQ